MITSVEEYSRAGGAEGFDFVRLPGTTKSSDIALSDEPVHRTNGLGQLHPRVTKSSLRCNEPLSEALEFALVIALQLAEPADEGELRPCTVAHPADGLRRYPKMSSPLALGPAHGPDEIVHSSAPGPD